MGQYHKEYVGTHQGNPSSQEKIKPKVVEDPSFGKSAKKGKVMDGLNAHEPDSFPDDGGAGGGKFKNQRDSEIKRGSI